MVSGEQFIFSKLFGPKIVYGHKPLVTSHTSEEQVTVLSINNYAKQFYVFTSDRVGVRVVIGVVRALMTL